MQEDEWEQVVQDFLIAQSAKDCSIMISIAHGASAINMDASTGVHHLDCLDPPCAIAYRVAVVRIDIISIQCR
jgi:hypothetical protein